MDEYNQFIASQGEAVPRPIEYRSTIDVGVNKEITVQSINPHERNHCILLCFLFPLNFQWQAQLWLKEFLENRGVNKLGAMKMDVKRYRFQNVYGYVVEIGLSDRKFEETFINYWLLFIKAMIAQTRRDNPQGNAAPAIDCFDKGSILVKVRSRLTDFFAKPQQ